MAPRFTTDVDHVGVTYCRKLRSSNLKFGVSSLHLLEER